MSFLALLFIVCVFIVIFYLCKYSNDSPDEEENSNSNFKSNINDLIETIKGFVVVIYGGIFGIVAAVIECYAVEQFFDIDNFFLDVIFFAFFYIYQGVLPIISILVKVVFPIIGLYTMYYIWDWSLLKILLFMFPKILMLFFMLLSLFFTFLGMIVEKIFRSREN